jgi:hypothetical protein
MTIVERSFTFRLSSSNAIRREFSPDSDNGEDNFEQKKENIGPDPHEQRDMFRLISESLQNLPEKGFDRKISAENVDDASAPSIGDHFSMQEARIPPNRTDRGERIRHDSSRSGNVKPFNAHLTWHGDIEIFQRKNPRENVPDKNSFVLEEKVPRYSGQLPPRLNLPQILPSATNLVYTSANTSGFYQNPQAQDSGSSGMNEFQNQFQNHAFNDSGFQNQQIPSPGFQNHEAGNNGLPSPNGYQYHGSSVLPNQAGHFQNPSFAGLPNHGGHFQNHGSSGMPNQGHQFPNPGSSGMPNQGHQFRSLDQISNFWRMPGLSNQGSLPANHHHFYNPPNAAAFLQGNNLQQNFPQTHSPVSRTALEHNFPGQMQIDPEFLPTTRTLLPRKNTTDESQNFDFTRKEPAYTKPVQPLPFSSEKIIQDLLLPPNYSDHRMIDISSPTRAQESGTSSAWAVEEPPSKNFSSKCISVCDLERSYFQSDELNGNRDSAKNHRGSNFGKTEGKLNRP